MKDTEKMFKLAHKLQVIAHEYGYEIFRDATAEACFGASDDTEDFEEKSLTQKYRYLANVIKDSKDSEPTFSNKYIED